MSRLQNISVCVVLLALTTHAVIQQTVHVRGKLLCGTTPIANMDVKLMDDDSGPDPDDWLDSGKTTRNGSFELSGTTLETSDVDAELKLYTDCEDEIQYTRFIQTNTQMPCQRKIVIKIPANFITIHGTKAEEDKILDIGTLNLEMGFPGEERDCIH